MSHSKETIEKIRQKAIERCKDPEYIKKLSESHKGIYPSEETRAIWREQRKGKGNPMYGRYHTEGTKKKIKEKRLQQIFPPDTGEKIRLKMLERKEKLGYIQSPEARKKISESKKGKTRSIETIAKMSKGQKENWTNPIFKEKIMKIRRSPEHKQKRREQLLRQWQDRNYKERVVRQISQSIYIKPNKSELFLSSILQEILPNEYAVNMKGEILILGSKIPDFVNVDGKKKLIELYGEYWHIEKARSYEDTEKGRIDYFKKFGWDTLIIWWKELKDKESLKQKILDYNET